MANSNQPTNSIDSGVASVLRTAQDTVRKSYEEYEGCVREAPGSSLACAVALGYFMRILPIGAVLAGVARLVAALAKPAILLFGAAKLYEYLQRQDSAAREQ